MTIARTESYASVAARASETETLSFYRCGLFCVVEAPRLESAVVDARG
jgi:hypothetical protein